MMALKPGYEWAEVLVMVKTYPAPSAKHGETVCVAGVRLDGVRPMFVRLYPISFRALEDTSKFKKYEVLRLPVKPRGTYDPRPESYIPDVDAIEHLEAIDTKRNWAKRKELVDPVLGGVTMCELIRLNDASTMADATQSLALVKPARIKKIKVEPGKPWKPNQLEKVRSFSQADLMNPDGYPELQPVPYQLLIEYSCEDADCGGHRQHLIDWELGVMGLTWPRRYGSKTAEVIEGKYLEILDLAQKDLYLFVGNQHQRRKTFSVCGIWYPKLA